MFNYYEWYHCATTNKYNTVCVGPYENAMDADKELVDMKIDHSSLVPVCKFMPTFMKHMIVEYKIVKQFNKFTFWDK